MEHRISELLPLTAKIAREFDNIPGLPHVEIEMAAQESLARAAWRFDPTKREFQAYAAAAIRNTLLDLYERQVRHHRHRIYDLDAPATQTGTTPEPRLQQLPASATPAADQSAALRESQARLAEAVATLSPQLRVVAEGKPVSDVWSFSATLYHLLTGKFPYRFDPKRDPIDIILNGSPVPIRDRLPGLETNLPAVIDKALIRNPKDRLPDAGKLLNSLPKPRA